MHACAALPFWNTLHRPCEKGRAGCESPKARGAEPHPQGLRLFNFWPQFWRPEWGGASLACNAPRAQVSHTRSGCRPM